MKSGKWTLLGAMLLAAVLLRAEMQEWLQHLPSGDWRNVFFRGVMLADGPVDVRRPPAETRPALTQLISSSPNAAPLYRLRAQEAELQLEFVSAEADWRHYVQLSSDQGAAWLELANYFDRRHKPQSEVDALRIVGRLPSDRFSPIAEQRSWLAFQRALHVISEQALPESSGAAIYQVWVERYPEQRLVRQEFVHYLISHKLTTAAEKEITAYRKAFPKDRAYPVAAAADLALSRGSAADALAVYERAFQPLWPDELTITYFKLLEDASEARAMVGKSRAALEQNPDDFRDAARLFLYWRQQNNPVAARRVLEEYKLSKQSRKVPWKPDEMYTIARLFEELPDAAEAAESYFALYTLPGANHYYSEQALSALANLLLTSPDQPIRFGSDDLSFYKDIAVMDHSPGFLNGILSLILNSTGPKWEYDRQNTASTAYFHRASAAKLVDLLDRRFPQSANRAGLHAQLIQAYNIYGDDETVIRSGREFLTAFPRDPARLNVAMTVADALARRHLEREEFALYDQLLSELARRAEGVPLGVNGAQARSPEYARVLDRYLSRLAALQRLLDAIRLYRREIARNPNDPGLYERLAAFLDQNHMATETEAVYKQAIAKFKDRGWYQKLARWYLRRQERAEIGDLTHQLIDIFSGTDLERYFSDMVTDSNLGPILYRQMNLYALQRFPEDLVFVHNLLNAYSTSATRDDAAASRLLRQYWFYDAGLRNRYFEILSSSGKLDAELAAVRAASPDAQANRWSGFMNANPAAVQFLAEAEAWRSHFEEAAPGLKAIAEAFPGDRALTSRATSVYRSLATLNENDTASAIALARLESRSDPRNRETLARIGDIFADHDRFAAARPVWNEMPSTAPGSVDSWRETATVFWDYYLYDDALRVIQTARSRLHDPALLAYEAGAIYEGKRRDELALTEYLKGYLSGDGQSEQRILKLARRPTLHNAVDRLTMDAADKSGANWDVVSLRMAVLQEQQRLPEIAPLLLKEIADTRSPDLLHKIEEAAGNDLADVRQQAIEREIAITQDPVEQARERIALVRFLESRKEMAAATNEMQALYREQPLILGVIRATVDYFTRNRQPQEAVRILVASAGRANDRYRDRFTLEAATLETGAHDFIRARQLLQPLLQLDPYRSEYLTAVAATYLHAGDDQGFRDFELATIKALRSSTLAPAERATRIAAMRRDLIPALTRLGDFAGAVDQYIDVINAYPEDEELIREASLYAARHTLGDRLTGFYRKTIADAPRDYRWPMVLARLETALEDFQEAIAAYDVALKARPDLKDLLADREAIEERSMNFDQAIANCQTLYELTYHDPQWMLKSATLKARLGRREDAIHDLQSAEIGGRGETPRALMAVAQLLDQWNYTADAAGFAERARNRAGSKGLAAPDLDAGLWARIMVRARRFDEVLTQSGSLPQPAVQQAGLAVREYYTPEEKTSVEAAVRRSAMMQKLAFAESAEFTQLEADLLNQSLAKPDPEAERKLVALEDRRARFAELARSMETYGARNAGNPLAGIRPLVEAESAWRAAGDEGSELRVLSQLYQYGDLQNRYLTLLNRVDRDKIVAIARRSNPAAAFAIGTGDFPFAERALQARGATLSPVWITSYTALSGIYDGVHSPEVDNAFHASLGGGAIGDRVRNRPDLKQRIVGSIWFYYGARYGEYLAGAGAANAQDYLPSALEATPGNPNAYFTLGGFYESHNMPGQAVEMYQEALELNSDSGEAENAIARVLWHENRREDAIKHWRAALAAFDRLENRGVRVPESFWNGVTATIGEIGREKQVSALRPDIEKVLRGYVNINGAYRSYELLSAAVRACFGSGEDYGWVLSLAQDQWTTDELLNGLGAIFHLTLEQQEDIARRRIANAVLHSTLVVGQNRDEAEYQVLTQRFNYLDLLLDHDKRREAQQVWEALSPEQRERSATARTIQLKLAAASGTVPKLLARYQSEPATAPQREELMQTADYLGRHGDVDAARAVLEFVYQRELDAQNLQAANFLGLAGVYLEESQTDRAVRLLRRMNLVSGEEFETFVPAATLLTEHGHPADAVAFVRDRMKAVPWDADARLQLARLETGDERRSEVLRLIQDTDSDYVIRSTAARMTADPAASTRTELGLLQHGKITPEEASKPYYVAARVAAGLYLEALAIHPSDEGIRLEALRGSLAASQDSLAIALVPRLYRPQGFLAESGLSKQARAEVARDVAKAYEREDELTSAINYLRIAITLGLDLDAKQKQLEAERAREVENAQRAPHVRDTIEQDRVVRPRLPQTLQSRRAE